MSWPSCALDGASCSDGRTLDSAFADDLQAAQGELCEALAIRAANAHLECDDSKQAMVLQKGLAWYVENNAPTKYSPRLKVEDNRVNADLIETLRQAVERIHIPNDARARVIEQQASGEHTPRKLSFVVAPEDLQQP